MLVKVIIYNALY